MRDTVRSKKLWFSAGAVLALFGYAVLTVRYPALVPLFDTFAGSVVAITGLLITGNVANKWVLGKTQPKQQPLEGQPVEESPPA